MRIFKKPVAPRNAPPPGQTPEPATYASSIRNAVRAEKRLRSESSEYRKTLYVSTTSNICERLNRNAKLVMNYLRRHMDPDTLQLILFLKYNREFWEAASVIDDILADASLSDDDASSSDGNEEDPEDDED